MPELQFPFPRDPGVYYALSGAVPCGCGEVFYSISAFEGHTAHCDAGLDESDEALARVGLTIYCQDE
jgi:hypothetical protein